MLTICENVSSAENEKISQESKRLNLIEFNFDETKILKKRSVDVKVKKIYVSNQINSIFLAFFTN
jgi:hypothetical protein